jgi:hypothetical protein
MAQTTLERVTDRVRELADRTGEVTNQAISTVVPSWRTSRTSMRWWQRRTTKAAPTAAKTAWTAGEIAGRMEGIAATIPNMTRTWLSRSGVQMKSTATNGGAKAAVRGMPASIAEGRMMPRGSQHATNQFATMRTTPSAQKSALLKRTAGMAAVTGGIAALRSRFSRTNMPAAKPMRQTTMAVPRGRWMIARRATTRSPLQGTQSTLRRSWRWVRYFTMGFALGAIWAYLFAPRRPSDEQQTSQRATTQAGAAAQQSATRG